MFVLGIDPGLTTTGYAVVDADGLRPRAVAAGAIRTTPGLPDGVRLAELFRDLSEVISQYRPAEMAMEQVFVNRNLQTATAVGRATGVVLLAAAQAGVPSFEYTPSAVKMAVTGCGDAGKDQVQEMVARRLGLARAPRPADAADALAVVLCHLQSSSLARAVLRAAK
jgi:crossover junction endodeoxyribonuclease RuvC